MKKLVLALWLWLGLAANQAWCDAPATTWLNTMPVAYQDAQSKGRLILVLVGASGCEPCRRLEQEMQKPEVQQILAGWTCVKLDADKPQDVPQMLAVGAIPALRVVDGSGKVVAWREGFVSGEELLKWLAENSAPAQWPVDADLAGGVPDAAAVGRLAAGLGDSNAAVRQACQRRLRQAPGAAAVAVVDALAQGKLALRLSALALLEAWQAPVAGLDPWQPETITAARIEQLKNWAASGQAGQRSQSLDAAELAAARAQLDRLAGLTAPDAAEACCFRLADYGPGLLPEVRRRLGAAATSATARQRLTELRYRLAANDGRLLKWAGGWPRLASGDLEVRRAAAGELTASAQADDAPLLLELFWDPDPVLRQKSLGALQRVSGFSANGALMQLLHDPEPEVRAAVLKQLADAPSAALAAALTQYAANEKDVDLVCQAVRALREIRTPQALRGLISLLNHPAWRVRSEIADALIEAVQGSEEPLTTQIYCALIKLLDDPDNFVVGRAVTGLKKADQVEAVDGLTATMQRHAEMAGDVVDTLIAIASDMNLQPRVAGKLRSLCGNIDPHVRAAALRGVAMIAPELAEPELLTGLKDSDAQVQASAAWGVYQVIEHGRGGGKLGAKVSLRQFESFHDSHGANTWYAKAIPSLQSMLNQDVDAKNLSVALALTALGYDDETFALLLAAAGKGDVYDFAANALPYLSWNKRVQLYDSLIAHRRQYRDLELVVGKMVEVSDERAMAKAWELLDARDVAAQDINAVLEVSGIFYWGGVNYDQNEMPAAVVRKVVADFGPWTASGTELKRTTALVMVEEVSPSDAVPLARKMMDDSALGEWSRLDALDVLLASLPSAQAREMAVQAFDWKENFWYKAYVPYLSLGAQGVATLHSGIRLAHVEDADDRYLGLGRKIVVSPLEGITPEALKALRRRADAAYVPKIDYLLCRCGDASGFAPLAAEWRNHHQNEEDWRSLVYRAAAVLNDDSLTPTLAEIYRSYTDKSESALLKNFYWTIRTIKGPNVLKLRKQIRAEVGMNNLR